MAEPVAPFVTARQARTMAEAWIGRAEAHLNRDRANEWHIGMAQASAQIAHVYAALAGAAPEGYPCPAHCDRGDLDGARCEACGGRGWQ